MLRDDHRQPTQTRHSAHRERTVGDTRGAEATRIRAKMDPHAPSKHLGKTQEYTAVGTSHYEAGVDYDYDYNNGSDTHVPHAGSSVRQQTAYTRARKAVQRSMTTPRTPGQMFMLALATIAGGILLLLLVLSLLMGSEDAGAASSHSAGTHKKGGAALGDDSYESWVKSHVRRPDHTRKFAHSETINRTLGFGKVFTLELPSRMDRLNALRLQADLVGIDYEVVPAVDVQPYVEKEYMGLTPSSARVRKKEMFPGEFGCHQAHQVVWNKVVEEGLETALILEGDVLFDVRIKKILEDAVSRLDELYAMHDPREDYGSPANTDGDNGERPSIEEFRKTHPDAGPYPRHNKYDIFGSQNWDMFFLTTCFDHSEYASDGEIIYDDPLSSGGGAIETEYGKRRLTRSAWPVCLAAYAVSQQGAKKLLLRSSVDSNDPIDMIVAKEVYSKNLKAYTINPPPAGAWMYKRELGLTGLSSSIGDRQKTQKPTEEEALAAWKTAHKDLNIWTQQYPYNILIRENALSMSSQLIFGQKPYNSTHISSPLNGRFPHVDVEEDE